MSSLPMSNLRATLDLAPDRAALVPPGRAKVRMSEGRVTTDFVVRNRRKLKSGWTRFYVDHEPTA